jgi:hypothetical protein
MNVCLMLCEILELISIYSLEIHISPIWTQNHKSFLLLNFLRESIIGVGDFRPFGIFQFLDIGWDCTWILVNARWKSVWLQKFLEDCSRVQKGGVHGSILSIFLTLTFCVGWHPLSPPISHVGPHISSKNVDFYLNFCHDFYVWTTKVEICVAWFVHLHLCSLGCLSCLSICWLGCHMIWRGRRVVKMCAIWLWPSNEHKFSNWLLNDLVFTIQCEK